MRDVRSTDTNKCIESLINVFYLFIENNAFRKLYFIRIVKKMKF